MQHEVVSLAEKVVLRAEDVIGWMRAAVGVKWDTGLLGVYGAPSQDPANDALYTPPISGALDIDEVLREKKLIGVYYEIFFIFRLSSLCYSYFAFTQTIRQELGVSERSCR